MEKLYSMLEVMEGGNLAGVDVCLVTVVALLFVGGSPLFSQLILLAVVSAVDSYSARIDTGSLLLYYCMILATP